MTRYTDFGGGGGGGCTGGGGTGGTGGTGTGVRKSLSPGVRAPHHLHKSKAAREERKRVLKMSVRKLKDIDDPEVFLCRWDREQIVQITCLPR